MIISQDTNMGPGGCSAINPNLYTAAMNLAAGTYKARVEFLGGNMSYWEYVLDVSVRQPGCGNGFIEAGEQCDDGAANGTAGDGCTATCTSIAPWEIEPNNSLATATPQWAGFSTWKGHIMPVGDHDYYTFTLASTGMVTLTTHDVDKPGYCTSDNEIHLLDHTGTQIAFGNDTSGPGPGDLKTGGKCAQVVMSVPAGQYYAWVRGYNDTKPIPSYQLDLLVQ
jgi:cysteine-rich repeat protein